MIRHSATLLTLLLAGCDPASAPPRCEAPLSAPDASIVWRHIAVGPDDGALRVRGFDNAAPPETRITAPDGTQTQADERGRFDFRVPSPAEDRFTLTFDLPSGQQLAQDFRTSDNQGCIRSTPIPTGTTPNDVVITECTEMPVGLVAATADAQINALPLFSEGSAPRQSADFPLRGDKAPLPFSVALDDTGTLAAASLNGQDAVALFAPCTGEVLSVAEASAFTPPLMLSVFPAVTLSTPLDVNGDGEEDNVVTQMLPRAPQGVAFADGLLLVTYTDLLQPALSPSEPAQFGPGALLAYAVSAQELRPMAATALPCINPQSATTAPDDTVWISCSGAFAYDDAGQLAASTDGALLQVQPSTLSILHVIEMGRFSPGTPIFYEDRIAVGSLLHGQVALLSQQSTSVDDAELLQLGPAEEVESVFELAKGPGGIALATVFSADTVVAIDLVTGELSPWPLDQPLTLREGGDATRGATAIAADAAGLRFATVLSLSAQVVPLDLRWSFGP